METQTHMLQIHTIIDNNVSEYQRYKRILTQMHKCSFFIVYVTKMDALKNELVMSDAAACGDNEVFFSLIFLTPEI